MASNNIPVKQFTKSLRGLPDDILKMMVSSVKVATLAQPHTKNRMIKFIVEHRENINVHQVDTDVDIEDRKNEVVGFTILMRIIIDICAKKCEKYTFGTLRLFIHLFYDISVDDKAVLFKSGLTDNLREFAEYISGKDDFENVYHFKEKFKEGVFDVIEKEIMYRVYSQASLLAGTHAHHTEGNNNRHQQFLGKNSEKLIIYSLCNANLDGFDNSFDFSPEIDEPSNTLPQFVDTEDISTPATSPTPPAPAAPPAPVAPVAPAEPAFTGSEPIVKIVTDPAECEKILEGIGNLMNPGHYQELSKHKISKHSWNKLRKKHNLKGRWDIYVETAEILGDKPRQNKNLKYQNPRHTLPGWEGVWNCNETGTPVSNHPYGTIYLVDPKMPLPPPS